MFYISIILNIIFILFGIYMIHKRGGINYVKQKLHLTKNPEENYHVKYYKAKKSIFDVMPTNENEIIFLGNSITDYCDWSELFNNSNIKNRGISGDVINGIINRLDQVLKSNPKKIFLMIGINDLSKGKTVKQISKEYEKLIDLIVKKSPETNLYIQSILPTDNRKKLQIARIIELNKRLNELSKKYNVVYINLFDSFTGKGHLLNRELTFDGLHLNGKGYILWKNEIMNYISKN